MTRRFEGVFPIMVTPFDESGSLDVKSIDQMVQFEHKLGVNGITILGIMGEAHKLLDSERDLILRRFIKAVDGRFPVIVGASHSATLVAVEYSKIAEDAGAAGILLAPPRLLRPNDNSLIEYYSEVANAVSIPIFVQDEPVFTGVHMSPLLLQELSKIRHVEYIKLEDAPTLPKLTRIRKLIGDSLGIFGGLGGIFCLEELERGASGIMTGFAFPELLIQIYNLHKRGDRDGASQLFYKFLPIIRYEAQPIIGLAVRKSILKMRGLITSDYSRAPTQQLDEECIRELRDLLARLGLQNTISIDNKGKG